MFTLQHYHYLCCNFGFQLWIFKLQYHSYCRTFHVICSSDLFDLTLLPFYSPKYDTNQYRKFGAEKQNLTSEFLSSWGIYIRWKIVLFSFLKSLHLSTPGVETWFILPMSPEIPHIEQVQNIQEIMVCVQGDSSNCSSTILWFCRLIKTKKKITALLPAAFVPSSGVFWGTLGLGEEEGFEYASFGFWIVGFLKEMDYV